MEAISDKKPPVNQQPEDSRPSQETVRTGRGRSDPHRFMHFELEVKYEAERLMKTL